MANERRLAYKRLAGLASHSSARHSGNMTEGPEFPLDLKNIISDCILALFWLKKAIIQFLEQSGAQATDLSVVRAPSCPEKCGESSAI